MKYNSIEDFVPSGSDFHASRQLFLELGFNIVWERVITSVLKITAVVLFCKIKTLKNLPKI